MCKNFMEKQHHIDSVSPYTHLSLHDIWLINNTAIVSYPKNSPNLDYVFVHKVKYITKRMPIEGVNKNHSESQLVLNENSKK